MMQRLWLPGTRPHCRTTPTIPWMGPLDRPLDEDEGVLGPVPDVTEGWDEGEEAGEPRRIHR